MTQATAIMQRTDLDLARRHMPALFLDLDEPYLPAAIGYSLHRTISPSPSSKFEIAPKGDVTIEYAIWYDWDIQHLYDLEHVWVHLGHGGDVLAVEASFHGQRVPMTPRIEDGRPLLFAEPGKHAHWADASAMMRQSGSYLDGVCGAEAGTGGVHLDNPFGHAKTITATPLDHRLARRKMERDAFTPSFTFCRAIDPPLMTWADLKAWIPGRVGDLIAGLPNKVPHFAAIFLDCGDTLIDESTEVKTPGTEIVTEAEDIPGAADAVRALHAQGWPLALVADGPRETFENLLRPRGLWDLMEAHVISGDIGVLKPDPKMFDTALSRLGLSRGDAARVVMVGNNLERDIRGARDLGLRSIHVAWSKRRRTEPAGIEEMPDMTIEDLAELPRVLAEMERALPASETGLAHV